MHMIIVCLDNSLCRLLSNALIQHHFDYTCTSWFPMLNKRLSKKMQSAQNKCIRFYLNLKNTTHVGATFPTKNRVDQHTCVNIMNFFKGMAPAYADEMFQSADQSRVTRRSKFKLNLPFRKSSAGQKCLSYMGPKIWNSLSSDLKSTNSINSFKHKIKDNFIQNIQREEKDIYMFY